MSVSSEDLTPGPWFTSGWIMRAGLYEHLKDVGNGALRTRVGNPSVRTPIPLLSLLILKHCTMHLVQTDPTSAVQCKVTLLLADACCLLYSAVFLDLPFLCLNTHVLEIHQMQNYVSEYCLKGHHFSMHSYFLFFGISSQDTVILLLIFSPVRSWQPMTVLCNVCLRIWEVEMWRTKQPQKYSVWKLWL